MPAKILDGDALASEMLEKLRPDIEALTQAGRQPHLVAIRANDNKGSASYAKAQSRHCEENGVKYTLDDLGPEATQDEILARIRQHNNDPDVSAILLHMPLPKGVDERTLVAAISPDKDAEGMTPGNLGRLLYPNPEIGPCTAVGAIELVKASGVKIEGANAVVVGHSQIVGKPLTLLLLGLNATTSVAHVFTEEATKNEMCRKADILISATGATAFRWNAYWKAFKKYKEGEGPKPEPCDLSPLIKAEHVKPGAVVIDVGVNRVDDASAKRGYRLVGDVDFDAAVKVASAITPVPGGVGPMTIAMLMKNTVDSAKKFCKLL